jgi:hypothetical protein
VAEETKIHGENERKFTSLGGENYLFRISQVSSVHPAGRSSMKVKNIYIKAKEFNILLNVEMQDVVITLFNINPVHKTIASLDSS